MSQKQQNEIDELRADVNKLIKEMSELHALLHPITADTIEHKRRGRPPKVIGHIQPND